MLVQSSIQLMQISPRLPGGFVLGYASSINADQVVEYTNAERAKLGLPPLTTNGLLNQAAIAKANHMFANDYWAHVAPDGTTPWSFIKATGYAYSVAGENLARDFNDTGSMMQAWMDSETHRANIVHQKYTQIGIAVVNGKLQGVETTLVVQLFGNPSLATPKTTKESASTEVLEVAAVEPVKTVEPVKVAEPVTEETPVVVKAVTDEAVKPVRVISPMAITKAVGTGLIVLLVLVLTYDSIMISKKNLPRKVGNNWAHIGFLSVIIIIIVAMTQGRVL